MKAGVVTAPFQWATSDRCRSSHTELGLFKTHRYCWTYRQVLCDNNYFPLTLIQHGLTAIWHRTVSGFKPGGLSPVRLRFTKCSISSWMSHCSSDFLTSSYSYNHTQQKKTRSESNSSCASLIKTKKVYLVQYKRIHFIGVILTLNYNSSDPSPIGQPNHFNVHFQFVVTFTFQSVLCLQSSSESNISVCFNYILVETSFVDDKTTTR